MSTTFSHGYALLIGVGTTAYAPWSLPVTVKDVDALRRVLVDATLCAYPNDPAHIRTLTDATATRDGILAGLAWLRACVTADPAATALVYYSGHGWVDKVSGAYYLVPHAGTPWNKTGSFLPATTFTAALQAIEPKRLLVFMDCCHAAGMADKAPDDSLQAGGSSAAFPKGLADNLAQGQGRAVFASSLGEEPSQYRPDGRLSIYTEHLLEALQGAGNRPGEMVVTVGNLMAHLGRTVKASAWRLRHAVQTPFFKFETEDFPVALLRGGKGLPGGGWAAVEAEAQATIERIIAGPGAVVAREINAPVATGGGIAASGNITITGDGNVIGSNNQVQVGGIHAGRIEAENVVYGVQMQGGTPEMAASLVRLAKDIQGGGITADEIKAGNVVSGVQFLAGKPPATQEELQQEVAALRAQVQVAIAAREIADEADAEDAATALDTAEAELAKAEPSGGRVVRNLKTAADILTGAADVAQGARKMGLAVIKLAPVAMMLWKLAESLF